MGRFFYSDTLRFCFLVSVSTLNGRIKYALSTPYPNCLFRPDLALQIKNRYCRCLHRKPTIRCHRWPKGQKEVSFFSVVNVTPF